MNLPDEKQQVFHCTWTCGGSSIGEKHGNQRGKNPHILRAKKAQPHLTYQTSWIILKREDTWNKLVWTVTGNILKAGTGSRIKTDRGFGKFRSCLKESAKPKVFSKNTRGVGIAWSFTLVRSTVLHRMVDTDYGEKVGYEKYLNTKSSSTPRNWTRGRSA